MENLTNRLMKYVEKTDTCWIWKGFVTGSGYGQVRLPWPSRRKTGAHRLSYMVHVGSIPPGAVVCHTCDEPLCVRPDHLFIGTQKDNQEDMVKKGRSARGECCGSAKLTWDKVRSIRSAYSDGNITQKGLGLEFGIDQSVICRILTGKIWKE